MISVSLPAAVFAGLLSFVSPCVLPLVPPYLTFLTGSTLDHLTQRNDAAVNRRAVLCAVLFVLGFATVFTVLGASASALGSLMRRYASILSIVAGVGIIVMGLHFLGVFRLRLLYREARLTVAKPASTWGAYAMGLAFAFGWTPCIGPVLASILAVAGSQASVGQGALLLFAYSIGLGIPFLLAALMMKPFVRIIGHVRSRFVTIERITGGLLVLTGIAFLTGFMSTASFWLLETFPSLQSFG